MKTYLSSFYPLSANNAGTLAAAQFNIPKFVDGSCRREPDFEHELPCITGLCRPNFVQKLEVGDRIIYVTNKKGIGSRRIVAVLEVEQLFVNHEEAAQWYEINKFTLPNNLMVEGNAPKPIEQTHRAFPTPELHDTIKWDCDYKNRSIKVGIVAQCKVLYKELHNPIELTLPLNFRKLTAQTPPILHANEVKYILNEVNLTNILDA